MTMRIEIRNADTSGRVCEAEQRNFAPGSGSGVHISTQWIAAGESASFYIHAGSIVEVREMPEATIVRHAGVPPDAEKEGEANGNR